MYITRGLEDRLKRLSRYFPAVAVSGARQTGKTTLLRHCFPEYDYVSLDLPSKAEQAELNPTGFLREHTAPVVIESLAGRIGMLDLMTQRVRARMAIFTAMTNQRSNPYRFLRAATLLLLIAAVSGCALFSEIAFYGDLFRANRAGVRFRRTYEYLHADVPFSDRSDVTLDVYGQPDGGSYPVLVFVHGGGWNSYDKELFTPVAMELLPQEMVVVIPDYTLYPDATWEQMAGEVADAAAWVLENIAGFGGDPERVYLSGHSAGAHLSGLVSYDPRWLAETGHSTQEIRGWIGLSGVYDTARHAAHRESLGLESPIMTAVMEGPENFAAASPETYAPLATGPPAWLIHGDADDTVPVAESENMSAALREAGVEAELIIYPGAGHSDFLFGALNDEEAQVVLDIGTIVRE